MDGWTVRWTDGREVGRTGGQTDVHSYHCMNACTSKGWMHGCMVAWMHGCMDGWMHAFMTSTNVQVYVGLPSEHPNVLNMCGHLMYRY